MSSPKSNLNRFAIAILLVSNIALCIFSLNKTVNKEEPNALIYRHHLKDLEMWYSDTDIAALRNLAFALTAKKRNNLFRFDLYRYPTLSLWRMS